MVIQKNPGNLITRIFFIPCMHHTFFVAGTDWGF